MGQIGWQPVQDAKRVARLGKRKPTAEPHSHTASPPTLFLNTNTFEIITWRSCDTYPSPNVSEHRVSEELNNRVVGEASGQCHVSSKAKDRVHHVKVAVLDSKKDSCVVEPGSDVDVGSELQQLSECVHVAVDGANVNHGQILGVFGIYRHPQSEQTCCEHAVADPDRHVQQSVISNANVVEICACVKG